MGILYHSITVGRISSKLKSTNEVTIKHWSLSSRHLTFTPCHGCDSTSSISDNQCRIRKPRYLTTLIPNTMYNWNKTSNEFITYLNNLYSQTVESSPPLELPAIQLDSLAIQLIKSSFAPEKIVNDLIDTISAIEATSRACGLTTLDIYTDGSLDHDIHTTDEEPI